jgi:hypothetical protein
MYFSVFREVRVLETSTRAEERDKRREETEDLANLTVRFPEVFKKLFNSPFHFFFTVPLFLPYPQSIYLIKLLILLVGMGGGMYCGLNLVVTIVSANWQCFTYLLIKSCMQPSLPAYTCMFNIGHVPACETYQCLLVSLCPTVSQSPLVSQSMYESATLNSNTCLYPSILVLLGIKVPP